MTEGELLTYYNEIHAAEANEVVAIQATIEADPRLERLSTVIHDWHDGSRAQFKRFARLSSALVAFSFEEYANANPLPSAEGVAAFIDQTVLPYAGFTEKSGVIEGSLLPRTMRACPAAESYFLDTLSAMYDADAKTNQEKVVVYHRDGQPIVIQKYDDERSGLTLENVRMPGFTIPTGSLVALCEPEELSGLDSDSGVDVTSGRQFEGQAVDYSAYAIDKLVCNPLRLSAWAYSEPIDRALFVMRSSSSGGMFINPERDLAKADKLREIAIDDFRCAARELMDVCGVQIAATATI